jgi:A/G-specific adenine glycosylase
MSLIAKLINWYLLNKRDLPWRNTRDPYKIWLSEIILQQTRVDQGLPYYHRFAEKYPEVGDFASASEDEILKMWQGLGYYSRGRNMHKTAQLVMEEHAGYFPSNYDDLIKLKGIGEYTAAAISSFSADEAKAVVDGNVFRVLARYFGIKEPINTSKAKTQFITIANEVIDKSRPAISNQALMEFGALHCRPKNPLCETCPLNMDCLALKQDLVNVLPLKKKKQTSRHRYFSYIVVADDNNVLMTKRGANDIWENLYELPLFETERQMNPESLINQTNFHDKFGSAMIKRVYGPFKHILSHQIIHAQFIHISHNKAIADLQSNNWFLADYEQLDQLAQPKLIFAFFKNFLNSNLNL